MLRPFAIFLIAAAVAACTKTDEHKANAALSDANNQAQVAADKTGAAIKKGYEHAKPELKQAGRKAGVELKKAGKTLKERVHEATAPSDADATER